MRETARDAGNPYAHRTSVEPYRRQDERVDVRDAQECEACGTRMYGLHCKIVCPNCGYKRDCSDP
jgi:rubrerythrin